MPTVPYPAGTVTPLLLDYKSFDLIEVSLPADMGTEPCAPPPGRRAGG